MSPIYLIIGVVILISVVSIGGYYYYKSQQRKEYIAKIEKLDEELMDLIDADNFFTLVNGEAVPKTQSTVNSTIEKIEDNIKDHEKTLKLLKGSIDISCNIGRNTILRSTFIDEARRSLTGSGSGSIQYNRNYFAKNFDDTVVKWKSEFKRGCSDVYEENGVELNR